MPWLRPDLQLLAKTLGVGFFDYGPLPAPLVRQCFWGHPKRAPSSRLRDRIWQTGCTFLRACLRSSEQQPEESQVDHLQACVQFAFAVLP